MEVEWPEESGVTHLIFSVVVLIGMEEEGALIM